MKIEILYPEVCNLFGDLANMRYLKLCLPQAEFIHTSLNQKPKFFDENIDLVYMGPTTENYQEKIIDIFMPYKDALKEKIDSGVHFLFVGNTLEILGNYIETPDGDRIKCLGLIDMYAEQNFKERHNSKCEGKLDNLSPILGFKTQFTDCYPANDNNALFGVVKGQGMNTECNFEGIRINNFFGTYYLGPLLIMNPDFTKYFLKSLGIQNPVLAFEEDVQAAYDFKLKEFNDYVAVKPEKYKFM
ncbi:MAG: hypothetical protein R3Y35_00835 [Clostridia bacterium]